jgi:hypothetical protein
MTHATHQALVALGDEEAALPMAVTATRFLVGDEAWRRRGEFCLRARDATSGKLRLRRGRPSRYAAASYARAANYGVSHMPRVSRKPPDEVLTRQAHA